MTKLRELRIKLGLSVKEVGEKVGIAPNYISMIERGERPLNAKTLKIFCDFYKVKPNELLCYDEMVDVSENDNSFTADDLQLLRLVKKMSVEDYDLLTDFVEFLIYRHQKKVDAYNDKKRQQN